MHPFLLFFPLLIQAITVNMLVMHDACINHSAFYGKCISSRRRTPSFETNGVMQLGKQTVTMMSASLIASSVVKKVVTTAGSRLCRVWKEIHGMNNWENLVEPLDPLLREEIIRYGEFIVACYKAFDLDPNSRRHLNCKYGKKNLLSEVGLENSGYEVTKYIYATPDVKIPIQNSPSCGRWVGYVAVSNDQESGKLGRRDLMITFRGTVTNPEWIANLMSQLTEARLDPYNSRPEVKVEAGFLSLYTSEESKSKFGLSSCREQLLSEVSRLRNKYQREEMSITIAGHSMGSSLALLLAYDISELGLNKQVWTKDCAPVTVFSFGGPRVGNSDFKERCEELGVKVLRVVNVNDPITKLPGVFFNEGLKVLAERYDLDLPWSCSCYAHVGVELLLDFFKMHNPSCVHDLETYIDLLRYGNNLENQREDFNFVHEAKKMASRAQKLNMLSWTNVRFHVAGMNQSQRT